jgi:DNA recombination protein RmuC
VVLLVFGLLTGILIGATVSLWLRSRLATARRESALLRTSLADTVAERDAARSACEHRRERIHELERDVVRFEGDLERERALAAEKLQAIEQANARAADLFKALSAEALRTSSDQFLELAKSSFGEFQATARGELDARERTFTQVAKNVADSLQQVDGKLERLDRDRREAQGALHQHLRSVVDTQEKLRTETQALVAALRKPDIRGRWGEMQLRRVVEMAGMTAYCDFQEQPTIRGEDGVLRPDLIVRMPGAKKVVVDAKVPLDSFLAAHAATDTTEREAHLRAHARQLREHIRGLSARSYWSQFEEAPDFVFLFLPGEHFYNAALEVDPTLMEEGINQSVLIATPTTLIALLRAVGYGWQQERIAESAQAISELGRELHTRLGVLADHLQTVSRRLRSTVEAFNGAVGSLDGRVLVTARRFSDHGAVSTAKELHDVEPVDVNPRVVQAPEIEHAEERMRALLPAATAKD